MSDFFLSFFALVLFMQLIYAGLIRVKALKVYIPKFVRKNDMLKTLKYLKKRMRVKKINTYRKVNVYIIVNVLTVILSKKGFKKCWH